MSRAPNNGAAIWSHEEDLQLISYRIGDVAGAVGLHSGARAKGMGAIAALALLLCASLLVALEDAEQAVPRQEQLLSLLRRFPRPARQRPGGQEGAAALPPHRFVVHRDGNEVRYLYAEPHHCDCIFIGTQANYHDYRDILASRLPQPDDVAPDYKTQASALLYGDPYDWNNLNEPDSSRIFPGLLLRRRCPCLAGDRIPEDVVNSRALATAAAYSVPRFRGRRQWPVGAASQQKKPALPPAFVYLFRDRDVSARLPALRLPAGRSCP